MSQWTWLDDQAVWGTLDIEPAKDDWAVGVALGGVQVANGVSDPASAADNLVECLTRYGFANDGGWNVITDGRIRPGFWRPGVGNAATTANGLAAEPLKVRRCFITDQCLRRRTTPCRRSDRATGIGVRT